MKPFAYQKVKNASEALKSKSESAAFIAGGTNLVDLMKKHVAMPDVLIDIRNSLDKDVKITPQGIQLGAMLSNTALTIHADVLSKYPLIAKAVLAGASPQIRNMASVGGNLLQRTRCPYFYDTTTPCNKRDPKSGCSAKEGANRMSAVVGYSEDCVAVHPSDLCVALAALNARVHVQLKNGKTFVIDFKDFHTLPGSNPSKDNTLPEGALITHITVPSNAFNQHSTYLKIRDRSSYAFALVSVAAALHLEGNIIKEARLASGGVAHKPWRWTKAEEFLKGKPANEATFSRASEIAVEGLKPLSQNAFKIPMLKGAIQTALQNCLLTH
jgi:xanthine dehydrogenase YagS FAD-binding subunit